LNFIKYSWLRRRRPVTLAVLLLLTACGMGTKTPERTITPTNTLPPPEVQTTLRPEADGTAQAFLEGWKTGDYAGMYALLSAESKKAITEEQFAKRYDDVANEAALSELVTQTQPSQPYEDSAKVPFKVTLRSAVVGDITREMIMPLVLEQGQWRLSWNDGLILPELAGGNYLKLDKETPKRASIYDNKGNPLAAQTDAVAIGVYPDYVDLGNSKGLLTMLSVLTNYRSDVLVNMINHANPGDYIPLGEIPADQDPTHVSLLAKYGAAVASAYSSRLYYNNGIAPHVVGYVSSIQKDELSAYQRKGYSADERIGRKGLESWGDDVLAGKHGGTLYVFSPEGQPVGQLGATPSQPGKDIYTTIDRDLQSQAQKAMSVYRGAIVVMERDTGRVLAMVSTPGFDPNAYETNNYNWNTLLNSILNNPSNPQFNRAAEGQYPLGSVFKLVTIAAGLESGRFTADSTYDCGYTFEELPGFTRYDWTWEHFQNDGETKPSGMLTLPQGLIRSCNPYFWHIGLDLYNAGLTKAVSDMARSYGLGSKTGIEGVQEEAGKITDPGSQVDAINNAIGQGETLVTPLQVARFVAALGNGGTLYRPQVIERIVGPDGVASFTLKPEAQGTLPLKPQNLALIQEAMIGVVRSLSPYGTARKPMLGLDIPIAGKTGTAESSNGPSHAWFAGYTMANNPDKPDIAVAVIAENAGEGSEIAAPIFRRIIELYFYGKPLRLYPWEATFDVTRSPTPEVTETPTPEPGKRGQPGIHP